MSLRDVYRDVMVRQDSYLPGKIRVKRALCVGTVQKALQRKRFRNKDFWQTKYLSLNMQTSMWLLVSFFLLGFYTVERAPQRKPPSAAFARASLSMILLYIPPLINKQWGTSKYVQQLWCWLYRFYFFTQCRSYHMKGSNKIRWGAAKLQSQRFKFAMVLFLLHHRFSKIWKRNLTTV